MVVVELGNPFRNGRKKFRRDEFLSMGNEREGKSPRSIGRLEARSRFGLARKWRETLEI